MKLTGLRFGGQRGSVGLFIHTIDQSLPTTHMPRRIYETYTSGDRVEIVFGDKGKEAWQPAVVLRADPPGIWVETADGGQWFMTNTYRIRPVSIPSGSQTDTDK